MTDMSPQRGSWDDAIARYLAESATAPEPVAPAAVDGAIGPSSPPPTAAPTDADAAPWPEVEPVIDVLGRSRELLAERYADSPGRRAAAHLRGLVRADTVPHELARDIAAAQQPVTTGRRVVVVGAGGGVGTTTTTALVGDLLARWRHDRVAVLAGRPDGNRLASLLPTARPVSPADVLAEASRAAESPCLLAVSHPDNGVDMPVDAVALWLCRTRAVTVVDGGTLPPERLLAVAHAVVLVVAPSVPGIEDARRVLTRLGADVPSVVAVVDTGRPTGLDPRLAATAIEGACPGPGPVSTVVIPVDRHVAGGVGIDPARLSERTTAAVAQLSAAALAVACAPQVAGR